MNFSDVRHEIENGHGPIPQHLQEMLGCHPFSIYLKKKFDWNYDEPSKPFDLDQIGIDVILHSSSQNIPDLKIQITHAGDHDMRPIPLPKEIDITGLPIVNAAVNKCQSYDKREIDTRDIILIIRGMVGGTQMQGLAKSQVFSSIFQNLNCFKGIYYVSDETYPLKPAFGESTQ